MKNASGCHPAALLFLCRGDAVSYTLRQVQTLLTKPELELFQASRANAIKELTERQLSSKITRTRTLRAKYRDLYQRQTVKTQKGPAAARRPAGNDNNRTEVKADVMQEVLGRFEERLAKVQADATKTAAKTAAVKNSKPAPAKSAAKKPAAAAKTTAAAAPRKKAAKSATKAYPAKAVKAAAVKKASGARKAASKAAVKKTASSSAAPAKASKTAANTPKVAGNATAAAQGAVPTTQPAAASRGNPIKAKPVNKKIQASGQSRTQAAQAKRDSR